MKTIVKLVTYEPIETFAEKHGLTMQITERNSYTLPRFFAHFEHAETKNGRILTGEFGNGSTPQEAIQEYAKALSGKLLVLNAGHPKKRREIEVGILR